MKQWIIIILASIGVFFAISGLLYWGSTYLDQVLLRIIAILLLWALPFSIGFAFYFGKVEARGFLHGADQVLEKILGPAIINLEKARPTKPQQSFIQVLPGNEYPAELQQPSQLSYNAFDYQEDQPRLKG